MDELILRILESEELIRKQLEPILKKNKNVFLYKPGFHINEAGLREIKVEEDDVFSELPALSLAVDFLLFGDKFLPCPICRSVNKKTEICPVCGVPASIKNIRQGIRVFPSIDGRMEISVFSFLGRIAEVEFDHKKSFEIQKFIVDGKQYEMFFNGSWFLFKGGQKLYRTDDTYKFIKKIFRFLFSVTPTT